MPVVAPCDERLDTSALLARARQGDAQAFGRLVEPLQARLLRQAMLLCKDAGAAEDIAAETLAQAWKGLASFNETCRLSTWLYAILLHRYQKYLRAARSRPIPLARLPGSEAGKHEEALQQLAGAEASPAAALLQQERAE